MYTILTNYTKSTITCQHFGVQNLFCYLQRSCEVNIAGKQRSVYDSANHYILKTLGASLISYLYIWFLRLLLFF